MHNSVAIILFIIFLLVVFFSSLQTAHKTRLSAGTTTVIQKKVTIIPTAIPTTFPTVIPTAMQLQHHSVNRGFGEGGDD